VLAVHNSNNADITWDRDSYWHVVSVPDDETEHWWNDFPSKTQKLELSP